ncbi:MAG: adenine phosphoribosyltransferase [Candidatus Eremiobacteraeota bacterium]|nr:adenine phosphoribosyltransferase [Candidatus Eremiobacteraeota bacterium]
MLRVLAAPLASAGATAPKVIVAASAPAVSNFAFIASPVFPERGKDSSRKTSCEPAGVPREAPWRRGRSGRAVPVQIESLIRAIPDFPIPGILFRDITPLLADREGFKATIDLFVQQYKDARVDAVVGIEARGYMLGAPVAYALGAGFVPVRKPGKLPGEKFSEEYALEYGTNTLEIHADAVGHGHRVLVVDDLLATGGTIAATLRLLEKLGADVVGTAVLIELEALKGRAALNGAPLTSFIKF